MRPEQIPYGVKDFKSLYYYYYGIVTMGRLDFDEVYFRVPNECVRRQIFEYMRSEYAKDADPATGATIG